jgi:transcription initiation factor IIE alpha subunit
MGNKTARVWYCDRHQEGIAETAEDEQKCPECGNDMKEIGWMEYASPSQSG